MKSINPTQVFSKTINHYDKSRPRYPRELFEFLEKNSYIKPSSTIADIGSGTGIFAEQLLSRGYRVISVEPNNDMRKIAEQNLAHYPLFQSINAAAEKTSLEAHSIDLVIAATAFHWFNYKLAKIEFTRILKSDGICALIWNVRNSTFPVMHDYEILMQTYVKDYQKAIGKHYSSDEIINEFYHPNKPIIHEFINVQSLDLEGFKSRILSTSYAPTPEDPNYQSFLTDTEKLFQQHQNSNTIKLYYNCKLYIGKL